MTRPARSLELRSWRSPCRGDRRSCATKNAAAAPSPTRARYPDYPTPDVPADAARRRPSIRTRASTTRGDGCRPAICAAPSASSRDRAARRRRRSIRARPVSASRPRGDSDYKPAATHFTAALAQNDRYVPALRGRANAAARRRRRRRARSPRSSAILTIDPTHETARSRLELLRFRHVQSLIDAGRKAREAGRLDDAQTTLERALALVAVERGDSARAGAASSSRAARSIDGRGACASARAARHGRRRRVRPRSARCSKRAARRARPRTPTRTAVQDRPAARVERDGATRWPTRPTMAAVPAEFQAIATVADRHARADVAALIGIRLERRPRQGSAARDVGRDRRARPLGRAVDSAGDAGRRDGRLSRITPSSRPRGVRRSRPRADVVSQLLTIIAGAAPDRSRDVAGRAPAVRGSAGRANVYYAAAALRRLVRRDDRRSTTTLRADTPATGAGRRGRHHPPAADRALTSRMPWNVLTAANQLTLLRSLLVPVFALCHAVRAGRAGRWRCFAVAGADRRARRPDRAPHRPARRRSAPGSIRWPTSCCSSRCS